MAANREELSVRWSESLKIINHARNLRKLPGSLPANRCEAVTAYKIAWWWVVKL